MSEKEVDHGEGAGQLAVMAAQGQADTLLPPELLVTPDGKAVLTGQTDAVFQKPAGVVSWQQPKAWLKECRRIATRYEKLAKHFLSMIHVAVILQFLTFA